MWKSFINLSIGLVLLNGCGLQRSAASNSWDQTPRWAQQNKQPGKAIQRASRPPAKSNSALQTQTQQASRPAEKSPPVIQKPVQQASLPTRKKNDSRWQVEAPSIGSSQQAGGILETAMQYLGTPYKWAGATPDEGFDCSGFVYYVYSQNGFSMARTADKQFLQGQSVEPNALEPGDLVFFETYTAGISHVGIYAGNDLFIHAPKTGRNVSYDSLASGYYQSRYRGAKRL